MPTAGIVLKLPKGSAAPQGWTYVRSLRTKNVYRKNAPAPVPQADIDAIIAGFAGMGLVAQANPVADLEAALAGLKMDGGRSKKTRRGGKKRKGTRRRRHH